jgi:hypothetical protein
MPGQEELRLQQSREGQFPWKKWGPYLSERQWGTVREDYSQDGTAWDYFSHDQARSRAYRWGEDGLGGICDDRQLLCFALAVWNGADPIIKERLFGLTNSEGNHGEDVKEYYFYLDNTPTHSYMKYLYKYPQSAYPYNDLVETNHRRGRDALEYELLDTGVFEDNRYFEVMVEYAKKSAQDILIQISLTNRGPETAALDLLPTLWFRNTWNWGDENQKPLLKEVPRQDSYGLVAASHPELGDYYLYCEGSGELLFTENETNFERIFGSPNFSPYVKDAFNNYLVEGAKTAVNPAKTGTKAAAHFHLELRPGETRVSRLRLCQEPALAAPFGDKFGAGLGRRKEEADQFYGEIIPSTLSEDEQNIMRQALAGMLWSKQFYYFDLREWLEKDPYAPPAFTRKGGWRNIHWQHLVCSDVISMPDKWEYPWFAAWDLAFHSVTLALVDSDFAKQQLELLAQSWYQHPSGQLPAYEWAFDDANPPVHAWAAWRVYQIDKAKRGQPDLDFLKGIFQKLSLNFTWWLNRKDVMDNNLFEGGFLGLDNIGVFDRSKPLPTGGLLQQADGTAWMAMYSLDMLAIALELALHDSTYQDMAVKYSQHFAYIAAALGRFGINQSQLWDSEDKFFYDLLYLSDGTEIRLKVRSMVGLLSLCASAIFTPEMVERLPKVIDRINWFRKRYPAISAELQSTQRPGSGNRLLLSILNEDQLRAILARMLDETEFLGDYGVRALSRYHKDHPYIFPVGNEVYRVDYESAESRTGLFGGNSNWRGPIWMPVNALLVEALIRLYQYYGDDFKVECPAGSGQLLTLNEVAREITNRLTRIFKKGPDGRRPVYGSTEKFQTDPYWHNFILFYEYFHGDNGAGIGASHQTGWTGIIAHLMQFLTPASSQVGIGPQQ